MATTDKIYIGSINAPTFIFDDTQIERIAFSNGVDLINNELSADALEADLFFDDTDGLLSSTNYATPLFYYSDNLLVSKYYVSQIKRTGVRKYKIYATSLIGLIENEDFIGGFYTGERFEEVVNDILFTNGVNMDKYSVYDSATNKTGKMLSGSYLLGQKSSIDEWKHRLLVEFTVQEPVWSSSSSTFKYHEVAGFMDTSGYSTKYSVEALASRANASSPTRWSLVLGYGTNTTRWSGSSSDYIFGNGTRFTVDIRPLEGKAYLRADYIQYDDATVTGTKTATWTIALYEPPQDTQSYHACLSVAFGMANFSRSYSTPSSIYDTYTVNSIIYHKQQVYDEIGNLILDAVYAGNESTGTGYMINMAGGTMIENNTVTGVGDAAYSVSDFTRIARDKELSKSLIFADNVANLPVRGWIKATSRRNALHELLFAENVNLLKTENGEYLFTSLSKESRGEIPEETIYNNPIEEVLAGAKKISVTEHSYETTDVSAEKIFDNSSSAAIEGEYLVMFDKAPIFGTPVGSGITIKKFNCNAAIVEGRGTISGTPYTHSQSIIQYVTGLPDAPDITVSNIGIITSANSDNVMNKLKAYYSGNLKKISNDIVYKGQRCGLIYSFKSLYQNSNSGYLRKISANVSSFVKAVCEFICGYVPPASGGYANYLVRTYGGSWTVPSSVRSREYPNIRVNIIGKGHAGTSGANGADGNRIEQGSGAKPGASGGAGGAAGTGGAGGNIYAITVDVSNVARVEVSDSGYDTIVKTYNDNNALLATYSSASGNAVDTGFTNVFDGTVYARKGLDGAAGGDGGKGGSYSDTEHDYIAPGKGGDVGSYAGGISPNGITIAWQTIGGTSYEYNSFGGGGGAAYGANGGNGKERYRIDSAIFTEGGAGAAALVTTEVYTEYGSGGFGGNGGGGGGGGAARYLDFAATNERQRTSYPEEPGAGGAGSAGTPGIDGCVVIYY